MDQFILFGDSITQQAFSAEHGFFGPALSDAYIRKLDIINRGLSGYNTSQALEILPKIMPSPSQAKVRFMSIFFGANDARLPNTPGGPQQHVPQEDFEDNLKAIATHPCVRAHQDIRLIIVTPPPVDERMLMASDEEKYGKPMLRRTATNAWLYACRAEKVGLQLGIPVLHLYMAMMAGSRRSVPGVSQGHKNQPVDPAFQSFFHDGLHFTKAGYKVLYEELMKLIQKTWPDQMPERLPFVFPAWDDEEAWPEKDASCSL